MPEEEAVELQVVMPAFNEAGGIVEVLGTLTAVLDDLGLRSWKVLVVDDHSADGTFDRVVGLGSPRLECLRLSRNSGSHVALRAGLAHCHADLVLGMAADNQDDPSAIREMLARARQGCDVVWAVRRKRRGEPLGYRLSAGLFYWLLQRLSRRPAGGINLNRADFFLLDRKVVEAVNRCPERRTSLMGLLAWLGFRQDQVEYDRRARSAGKSRWTTAARLRMGADWILAFSELPLKLATFGGLAVTLAGLVVLLVLVGRILLPGPVEIPGWLALGALVAILSGVQMMMLGIVGEYLWRTYDDSRGRPLYCVEKRGPQGED